MHHPQQTRMSPANPRMTAGAPQAPPAAYYAHGRPPPSGMPVAPSAKRFKPTPGHPGAAQAAMAHADPAINALEEEEDTALGDLLDHMSPREIALTRYKHHHEWMEEVLESVYTINKIKPVDLGLGLWGELEPLTKGLLEMPVYPIPKRHANSPEPEEKDQKEVLAEFRKRVETYLDKSDKEIRKMDTAHRARLDKIQASSMYRDYDNELRQGLEELTSPPLDEDGNPVVAALDLSLYRSPDEIQADAEEKIGKKIVEDVKVLEHVLPQEVLNEWGVNSENPAVGVGGGMDTVMEENGVEDDAFKLDIPTPSLQGFEQPGADEPMMEDTMMADFIEDMQSKPETSGVPGGEGEGAGEN